MVQFGWKAGAEQYRPEELLDYVVAAEAAGFDAVDASDHFHPWAEKGQACFIWSWLGAAAAKTKRITLGTGITCPILRYHPSIIAQAAATMACLAPGRFYLGVGTGEALNEYSATGLWPSYKERQEQLAEAIALIRALWTGEKVTHNGTYYQTHKAKLYTRPKDSIPLYISSLVPNSAVFAGKHGDGLITVGEEKETVQKLFENFDAGAKEAGKKPKHMPRLAEVGVAFTDDEEKAIACQKEFWAGTAIPAMFTERLYTPEQSEQNGAVVGSESIRKSMCISTDPKKHVEHARKFIEMGFTHLFFHCPGPDQKKFIEAYGREVLPRLRKSEAKRAA